MDDFAGRVAGRACTRRPTVSIQETVRHQTMQTAASSHSIQAQRDAAATWPAEGAGHRCGRTSMPSSSCMGVIRRSDPAAASIPRSTTHGRRGHVSTDRSHRHDAPGRDRPGIATTRSVVIPVDDTSSQTSGHDPYSAARPAPSGRDPATSPDPTPAGAFSGQYRPTPDRRKRRGSPRPHAAWRRVGVCDATVSARRRPAGRASSAGQAARAATLARC